MGVGVGGEWIHVCVAESLRCSPETFTTLLISYTLYKIKSFFGRRHCFKGSKCGYNMTEYTSID